MSDVKSLHSHGMERDSSGLLPTAAVPGAAGSPVRPGGVRCSPGTPGEAGPLWSVPGWQRGRAWPPATTTNPAIQPACYTTVKILCSSRAVVFAKPFEMCIVGKSFWAVLRPRWGRGRTHYLLLLTQLPTPRGAAKLPTGDALFFADELHLDFQNC